MTGISHFPLYIDRKKLFICLAMMFQYLNASYSVLSYAARRYAAIPAAPPLPPAISVELSSRCNLSCPECVTGAGLIRRKHSFLSNDLASSVAARLRGRSLSAWLSFQGEPMLHPEFFTILALFRGLNPVISTNGHYLDAENCLRLACSPLKKIIISYDGATAETYGIYRRGGDHALVAEGIRQLSETVRERRSKLKIVLQFLVHRGNEHDITAAAAFARSVGAGFRIKTMQVLDPARAGAWMPSDRRLARYACGEEGSVRPAGNGSAQSACGEEGSVRPAGNDSAQSVSGDEATMKPGGSPARGCMRMWTSSVITTDGDVVPCCYDKNGLHVMGNLENQTFPEIWRGEKYRSFRDKVMMSRSLLNICNGCPEGRRLFY